MIFYLIALAANVFGWYSDFDESRRKAFYGKQEGNLFFRGKNGQLNVPKAIAIFLIVEIGVSVVIAMFLHLAKGEGQSDNIGYYGAACWCAAFAVLHYLTYRSNAKKSRENRIKQIAKREEWQSREWTTDEFARKYLKSVRSNDGETFLLLFAWIRVPQNSEQLTNLAQALIDWSKVPDAQAWPDRKFHPEGV